MRLLSEAARAMNRAGKVKAGGRPRSAKPRCPCGLMTKTRAEARRHKCLPTSRPRRHLPQPTPIAALLKPARRIPVPYAFQETTGCEIALRSLP